MNQAFLDKEIERVARGMAKKCPLTWQAISAKRYIVPQYRQVDYHSQAYLDAQILFFLAGYFGTGYGQIPDPVIRATYMLEIMALREGRPIYYLERELAEKMMVTKFPGDLTTDYLHWRRQGLRIMLPKGLLGFQRQGQPRQSLMFLDVARLDKDQEIRLAPEQEAELTLIGRIQQVETGRAYYEQLVRPHLEHSGFVIGGQLDSYFGPKGNIPVGEHYAVIRPNGKLGEVMQVGASFDDETHSDTQNDSDQTLLERMQHLALNVLLFMGSVPIEYEVEKKPPGPPRGPIEPRFKTGLFPAKFVGQSQYRPSARTQHYHTATWSGRKLPKHWRCGHWRHQAHGEGRVERKLIWIEPYETFGPGEEDKPDLT